MVALGPVLRQPSIAVCAVECGAQCCRAPGHFSLQHHELIRLNHLAKEIGVLFKVYQHPDDPAWYEADHLTNGGACSFLDRDTNLCRIYEWRPDACRSYPQTRESRCRLWEVAG